MSTRRDRKKDRTRRALLDAASRLFGERGIYDTRVEDITEAADLGKGAFYNYFETKDGLVAELLAEALQALATFCDRVVTDGMGIDERVRRLAAAHQAFLDEHSSYPLLIHQARGLAEVAPSSAPRIHEVFEAYLGQLGRQLVPPGTLPRLTEDDRLDLAAAFAGAVTGYRSFRVAANLERRPRTIEDVVALGLPAASARMRAVSTG